MSNSQCIRENRADSIATPQRLENGAGGGGELTRGITRTGGRRNSKEKHLGVSPLYGGGVGSLALSVAGQRRVAGALPYERGGGTSLERSRIWAT